MKKMKHIMLFMMLVCSMICARAQAPVISSFNPSTGVTGAAVTINGKAFSTDTANNVVYFGPVRAKVNKATATQLNVSVPAGATYSAITVINKASGLSGRSALMFSPGLVPVTAVLGSPVRLASALPSVSIRLADIDGDGKPDILATDPVSGTLMVYRNKSQGNRLDTGSFTKPLVYKTGQQPSFVAVDDLNGDGLPDVVLMNTTYSGKANGDKSLAFYTNASTPGNINLLPQALTDTAASQNVYRFKLSPGDYMVRIGDIDGNGRPDMMVLNTAGFMTIYSRNTNAGPPLIKNFNLPVKVQTGAAVSGFIIGDLDNDNKPDILLTKRDSSALTVLRNNITTATIQPSSFQRFELPLGFKPFTVALADADGDGRPDVWVSRDANKLALYRNTSIPGRMNVTAFTLNNLNILSDYNDEILLQDADVNGKPDIITMKDDLTSAYLYTNKAITGQTTPAYFNDKTDVPLSTIPDAIGDLDGDGKPEIIVGSHFGIDIYPNRSVVSGAQEIANGAVATNTDVLNLYPNPATAYTNIKYSLPVPADVFISVRDNYGKVVKSFKTGGKPAGEHTSTIQTADLKTGLYLVSINADGYEKIAKLLIQ